MKRSSRKKIEKARRGSRTDLWGIPPRLDDGASNGPQRIEWKTYPEKKINQKTVMSQKP